jgi:hypothetical protein
MMSVMTAFAALLILVWASTGTHFQVGLSGQGTRPWWNNDSKLAVTFTTVVFLLGLIFLFEQFALYSFSGKDDADQYD